MQPPRPTSQRKTDVLAKLGSEVDLWVASADAAGNAYLVPLSFYWDGEALTISTPRTSRTGANLIRGGTARVALGGTRDVVMIDGTVEIGADPELQERHARATGFDPRTLDDYVYLRITPQAIQAWREENELAGRWLMRKGEWLG